MEDKFKLDKLNIYMIIITFIIFVILIFTILKYVDSNKHSESKLPNLETTAGLTSTSYKTTTTVTTVKTTTTTIDYTSLNSPYYQVDTNILNEDIFRKKDNITDEEAKYMVEQFIKYANAFYDTNDYSIFNTDLINKAAKENESDKIVQDNFVYCELYNASDYIDKVFYEKNFKYKINNVNVIRNINNKYYRMMTDYNYNYVINNIDVELISYDTIKANISFVLSTNNKHYKAANIVLGYQNGVWKIKKYDYPI